MSAFNVSNMQKDMFKADN